MTTLPVRGDLHERAPGPSLPPERDRRGLALAPWVRWLLAAGCLGALGASCGGDSFSSNGGQGGEAEGGDTGESGEAGADQGGSRPTGGRGGAANVSGGATAKGGGDPGGAPPEGGGRTGTGGVIMDGGKAGTTGGTTAEGGAIGTGGAIGEGGTGNAGGGPNEEGCRLPADPGPCDGTIPRYAFDAELGICTPFTYGGCEGNDNNFETLEACYGACGEEGDVDSTSCEDASDCFLRSPHCCDACEPVSVGDFVGVNAEGSTRLSDRIECAAVLCGACPEPVDRPERAWIGVKCASGRCQAYDARETELTDCSATDECRLRYGTSCCEGCEGMPDTVIAVSTDAEFGEEYCPGDVACAGCVPPPPPDLAALCVDERCTVETAVVPNE